MKMQHAHHFGWQKAQLLLCFLCIGCALLLIVLSLNGRTVWTEYASSPGPTAGIRDAAGWDWLARGAGVMTIIALSIGLSTRRRWLVITCTATASVCLAWAAYVAWHYSQDIAHGLVAREGYTVRTPEQIGVVAQVAVLGSALALLLLLGTIVSGPQKDYQTTQP
jgi:hypothetical protein